LRAVRVVDGQVRVVDVPAPSGPGVRVSVRAVGICGTDLHLVGSDALDLTGLTLGHEIAGVTDDGTPVAVEPLAPCGECAPCRRGDYNLCLKSSEMIFGVGMDGGMAGEIRVPESALVPLPAGLDVRDASLVEPLAVLVYALRRSELRPDQRVAVVGGGTLGLCAVAVARARGAEVALIARHDSQRAAGERLGAAEVSGEYDLVVEAAGTESALARAVELARPGGTISIPAIYWDQVVLPGLQVCFKEITLRPATLYARHGGGRDVDAAAALLASSPKIAETLITHRFPLDEAPEAFATAAQRSSGAIKVVLEP